LSRLQKIYTGEHIYQSGLSFEGFKGVKSTEVSNRTGIYQSGLKIEDCIEEKNRKTQTGPV